MTVVPTVQQSGLRDDDDVEATGADKCRHQHKAPRRGRVGDDGGVEGGGGGGGGGGRRGGSGRP